MFQLSLSCDVKKEKKTTDEKRQNRLKGFFLWMSLCKNPSSNIIISIRWRFKAVERCDRKQSLVLVDPCAFSRSAVITVLSGAFVAHAYGLAEMKPHVAPLPYVPLSQASRIDRLATRHTQHTHLLLLSSQMRREVSDDPRSGHAKESIPQCNSIIT